MPECLLRLGAGFFIPPPHALLKGRKFLARFKNLSGRHQAQGSQTWPFARSFITLNQAGGANESNIAAGYPIGSWGLSSKCRST